MYFLTVTLQEVGWGSTTIYRQTPIDTECAVAEVAESIKEHNNLDTVAIINFILLNTKGR